MPSWRDEYLSALQERDRREKAYKDIYQKYTKLADQVATLQPGSAAERINDAPASSPKLKDRRGSKEPAMGHNSTPDVIAKVRQDLSEAQRSRGLMETKLQSATEELNKLKIQNSLDNKRISELMKEKTVLDRGLRDRDEELRGKAKLLEDVHDETVSLTLQLNMAEEQGQKLARENRELVDRWMKRMGQEADAMNDKSMFS